MKKHFLLFTLLSLFAFTQIGWGTDYTSTGTATWSAEAWSPAGTPGASDNVTIADGHTVTIDVASITIASLTVGQGISGTLLFDRTTGRALIVSGNIEVKAGGSFLSTDFNALTPTGDLTAGNTTITNVSSTAGIAVGMVIAGNNFNWVSNPATITAFDAGAQTITVAVACTTSVNGIPLTIQLSPAITQTLTIGGNLINNGTFDMSKAVSTTNSSTTVCNVIFNNTTGDQTISGATPVLTRFQGITLSKSSISNKVVSTIDTYIGGSQLFVLTAGTWNQHAGNLINGSGSKTLGVATGKLLIDGTGGYTNYVGPSYQLPRYTSGSLAVTAGTLEVNTFGIVQIGVGNNSVTTGGTINLLGGNIYIYGRLTFTNGNNTINGANIYIDPNPDPSLGTHSSSALFTNAAALGATSGTFEVSGTFTSPTTTFTFSSGSVTLVNPNAAATSGRDLKVTATGNGLSITGGTIYIGDGSSTRTSSTFTGFVNGTSVTLPNSVVVQTGNIPGRNFSLSPNNLDISGSLTVAANGVFDCSAKLLSGSGAFTLSSGGTMRTSKAGGVNSAITNTGTITLDPGANYEFDGPTAAAVTGLLMPATINNLIVNNSTGVTLSQATIVNGTLTLNIGTITTTAANLLTFTEAATVGSYGSATSFVDGPMAYVFATSGSKSRYYPIGKGGIWRPLVLSLNQTFATSSTYTAEAFNSAPVSNTLPGTLDKVSLVRYHTISETGGGSAFTAGSLQRWYGTDDGVTDISNLRIAQGPAGGGIWVDLGGSGTVIQNGNITSNSFTDLTTNTIFTLANHTPGGTNPLPIELSSFTAASSNGAIVLSWKTAVETKNHGFDVERSADNKTWTKLTFIQGHGNSNSPENYSYTDNTVGKAGKYYYRLKQLDNDGGYKYSSVAEAEFVVPDVYSLSQNYPNPFNPSTKINYSLASDSRVTLDIYNILGVKVGQLVNQDQSAGYYSVAFSTSSLNKSITSGVYLYKMTAVDKATGNSFSVIKKMMMLK